MKRLSILLFGLLLINQSVYSIKRPGSPSSITITTPKGDGTLCSGEVTFEVNKCSRAQVYLWTVWKEQASSKTFIAKSKSTTTVFLTVHTKV
jgi:hypothetical protein